jgi:hypothetical protein
MVDLLEVWQEHLEMMEVDLLVVEVRQQGRLVM